jgi:hypothetical protein
MSVAAHRTAVHERSTFLTARRGTPWLVFLLALAVYLSTGQKVGSGDAIPSSLIPITVLLHGTTRLDEFTPALKEKYHDQTEQYQELPYFVEQTAHGVMSRYPVATGLLATPILALPILVIASTSSPTPKKWLGHAYKLQFYSAAIITATTAALFWLVCSNLGFSFWFGLGLTILYAFGSEAFCTSSQTLWQHGPGVLFFLAGFFCFIRLQAAPQGGWVANRLAILLSLAVATAVAVRPTNLLLVGPIFVLALWQRPRLALALALPGALIGAALLAYNLYFFDSVFGGYGYIIFDWSLAGFRAGLAGLLFSPGRGLFLYFPFAAVALLLILRRPSLLRQGLPAALAVSIVSSTALFSFFSEWDGGWSVGPRYLTEVQPLILILAGIGWQSLSVAAQRRLGILCFGILLPYSIFIQAVGSYSAAPLLWNRDREGDYAHAVWDFRDNPIARGLW